MMLIKKSNFSIIFFEAEMETWFPLFFQTFNPNPINPSDLSTSTAAVSMFGVGFLSDLLGVGRNRVKKHEGFNQMKKAFETI